MIAESSLARALAEAIGQAKLPPPAALHSASPARKKEARVSARSDLTTDCQEPAARHSGRLARATWPAHHGGGAFLICLSLVDG